DRNIRHFLNVSRQTFKRLEWKEPVDKRAIDGFIAQWDSKSEVIERLSARRNKFFAHYDKEHFYEPDTSLALIPFGLEDAKDLTRLLQQTLGFFSGALLGPRPLSMEGFVYGAAERLYETMRKAHAERQRSS
ncbi:MAG TPA: hypothetical protein VFR28_11475, partial [Allosphingosinicella sp.]|nr:hypothetical protein [Allosphingosinicella sp.]